MFRRSKILAIEKPAETLFELVNQLNKLGSEYLAQYPKSSLLHKRQRVAKLLCDFKLNNNHDLKLQLINNLINIFLSMGQESGHSEGLLKKLRNLLLSSSVIKQIPNLDKAIKRKIPELQILDAIDCYSMYKTRRKLYENEWKLFKNQWLLYELEKKENENHHRK